MSSERAGGEVGFEEIYARASSDLESIPWASLSVNPALTAWMDREPAGDGRTGLVVGCGLGDDAEELARHGYRVTAFDLSPSAIDMCRSRFPESSVSYVVADLFAPPQAWAADFELVIEIRTLQSLSEPRPAAAAIAAMVAPGGELFVRCLGRDDGEPVKSRPWPLTRTDLRAFVDAGLVETSFVDQPGGAARARTFTGVYRRPADSPGSS